ncbi:hypothetical protein VF_A0190 [Aliivibrio fischeri ES114]|uniref:Uncharacterized protein n=1 Tax=Aliivibrio fischeri (strain ATCC 700601 / ES114) TaxID=312309 RepID=Q5E136_ALIF1|nr:hypothetical protein VF_A0190 [Aliivibrio fischeri ES114]KLU78096.1 hypothetical protein AB192_15325 [Aliivibrio fischeri]
MNNIFQQNQTEGSTINEQIFINTAMKYKTAY